MVESLVMSVALSTISDTLYDLALKKMVDIHFLKDLESKIAQELVKEKVSNQEKISDLTDAYKKERLVLVLGAGVSIGYGLPNWDTLLQKLLLNTFIIETREPKDVSLLLAKLFTEIFSPSPLISARYLREYYKENPKKEKEKISFEEAVKNAIYEEIDLKNESDLFKEIRQFCVAPGKSPNLDSIITYNYDDILETYLSALDIDIPYKAIHCAGINPTLGELPIYHVHGFLPQKGVLDEENGIILSEDMYHQQYSEIYSWNNMIQIEKFRDKTCLFIGISFTDPNLRRLLDIAKSLRGKPRRYHYLIKKQYDSKTLEENLSKILEQKKKLLEDGEKMDLGPNELAEHLVNLMVKFEENDALSFGVRIIWIKNYKEIPGILKSIRQMGENLEK